MTTVEDRYLGDGVYASYDGYYIVLDLRGQDNYTRIALEPTVMRALKDYEEHVLLSTIPVAPVPRDVGPFDPITEEETI